MPKRRPRSASQFTVATIKQTLFVVCAWLLAVPPCVGQTTGPETTDQETTGSETTGAETTGAKTIGQEITKDQVSADQDAITWEELEQDPEFQAELAKRKDAFQQTRDALADALARQHAILVRYRNSVANSPADREAYRKAAVKTRQVIDELYQQAMELVKISPENDAAQYLVTLIKHRLERSIYDLETAEGAARLIDGGGKLLYLFSAAGRSAVCSGQFDVARRVYQAISEDQLDDIDRRFVFQMDQLEQRAEREQKFRDAEAEADDLPRVKFETSKGDIVLELFLQQAPSTVSHFIQLVEEGFYDGLDFHQIIDNLLAMTGDPSGLGDGHSGSFLIDEHLRPDARDAFRGSLVMAKLPKGKDSQEFFPNTGSSQFAILMVPLVGMEDQQTVFGRVIQGMNVIGSLRRVDPTKEKKKGEIELPPDYIVEATVLRRPETLPQPDYLRASRNARVK